MFFFFFLRRPIRRASAFPCVVRSDLLRFFPKYEDGTPKKLWFPRKTKTFACNHNFSPFSRSNERQFLRIPNQCARPSRTTQKVSKNNMLVQYATCTCSMQVQYAGAVCIMQYAACRCSKVHYAACRCIMQGAACTMQAQYAGAVCGCSMRVQYAGAVCRCSMQMH